MNLLFPVSQNVYNHYLCAYDIILIFLTKSESLPLVVEYSAM